MKKFLLLLVPILFLFLVSGCNSKVSPDDISKISLGMSPDKVVDVLGKPSKQTTDRDELTGNYDNLATLYASKIEFDENEDDKYRGYGEYHDVFNAIKNKENVEVYEYETNEDKHTIYIYFLNDEVSFFFDLDLG